MFPRIKHFLLQCFTYETSPHKLTIACALATYIAFCPFVGVHTIMAIGLGFLLRLNVPFLLAIGWIINNPFTMIPVYMSGYLFGHFLLHSWWGVSIAGSNPWWMYSVNAFLQSSLGIKNISFWAFMIGGNVLGIFFATLCYIVMLPVFVRLASQQKAS